MSQGISEYDRGALDERERIIAAVREAMREWKHTGAPGCVACETARMLAEVIKRV